MIKAKGLNGTAAVTFTLPAAVGARRAAVCGEWNNWSPYRDVMKQVEDGFSLTLELAIGRTYRFRYLLDGHRWENDWSADSYVPNNHGGEDSLVDLTAFADLEPTPPLEPPPSTPPPPSPTPAAEAKRAARVAVEREAKLVAPAGVGIPDLAGLVPGATAVSLPVRRLDAVYYDTAELRLARSGITLRHRAGEAGPAWTIKFPENGKGSELARNEIRFDGPPDLIPNAAADLVLASTRAQGLGPVAQLTTVRRPLEIRDRDGKLLAEVVDDTVSVSHDRRPAGRFREIEVELHAPGPDGRRILDAAVSRLVAAGCSPEEPPLPKLVRALGEAATRPPDVIVTSLEADATVVELVRYATARSVAQIVRHDPGTRLGIDVEALHQMRVATRRLRSDLHTFGPLLDRDRVTPVRAELAWLGGVVGDVRNTDVLGARFTARLSLLHDVNEHEANRLMSRLENEAERARAVMLAALRDARYLRLLDTLVELAAAPPFAKAPKLTRRPPRKTAARIARKPWRHLAGAVDGLGPDPSDAELHRVRILAKRSRYAAEAVAPLIGSAATRFAAAVADLQTVLGDHQDTVMAEHWLRDESATTPPGRVLTNQLIAQEQSCRSQLRAQWPAAWRKASAKKLRSWL
jgi:CHAD domain-containing protein